MDKRTPIYSWGASPVWVDGGSPCYLRDLLLLLGLSEKEEEMESHAGSGAKVKPLWHLLCLDGTGVPEGQSIHLLLSKRPPVKSISRSVL